ncbi:hypothetical protein SY88_17145 [Clostridiales bacterium PH28_bin88]|nr:hypothetical protein SY88_17145 [Clostridiales bacterium PH28_bin88]
MLDDYHVVAGTPVVNETVHFLLNNLPPNVHLCLAGRHQPPLRVERLALQAQVHDVGPQELAFEVEEVKQLLSRVNGGSIAPGLADEIAVSTECWPAGVVLAVQSARKGKGIRFGRGVPPASGGESRLYTLFYDL